MSSMDWAIGNQDGKLQCKICKKRFLKTRSLKFHLNQHLGSKQHKCDQCGKRFSGGNSLINHMKAHANDNSATPSSKSSSSEPSSSQSSSSKSSSSKSPSSKSSSPSSKSPSPKSSSSKPALSEKKIVQEVDLTSDTEEPDKPRKPPKPPGTDKGPAQKITNPKLNANSVARQTPNATSAPQRHDYICTFCDKGFNSSLLFSSHVTNKHKDRLSPQKDHSKAKNDRSQTNDIPAAPVLPPPNAKCEVCFSMDSKYGRLVRCVICETVVHTICYGCRTTERNWDSNWKCSRCVRSPHSISKCVLCGRAGGAFKPTKDGKWAHLVCGLWINETYVDNLETMEPIMGVDQICEDRWKLRCIFCNRRGSCVQCSYGSCTVAFHPLCGYHDPDTVMHTQPLGPDVQRGHDAKLLPYCPKHKHKSTPGSKKQKSQVARKTNKPPKPSKPNMVRKSTTASKPKQTARKTTAFKRHTTRKRKIDKTDVPQRSGIDVISLDDDDDDEKHVTPPVPSTGVATRSASNSFGHVNGSTNTHSFSVHQLQSASSSSSSSSKKRRKIGNFLSILEATSQPITPRFSKKEVCFLCHNPCRIKSVNPLMHCSACDRHFHRACDNVENEIYELSEEHLPLTFVCHICRSGTTPPKPKMCVVCEERASSAPATKCFVPKCEFRMHNDCKTKEKVIGTKEWMKMSGGVSTAMFCPMHCKKFNQIVRVEHCTSEITGNTAFPQEVWFCQNCHAKKGMSFGTNGRFIGGCCRVCIKKHEAVECKPKRISDCEVFLCSGPKGSNELTPEDPVGSEKAQPIVIDDSDDEMENAEFEGAIDCDFYVPPVPDTESTAFACQICGLRNLSTLNVLLAHLKVHENSIYRKLTTEKWKEVYQARLLTQLRIRSVIEPLEDPNQFNK